MTDPSLVNDWRDHICDRLTAGELVELLDLTTGQVFDAFVENCLELNVEDVE